MNRVVIILSVVFTASISFAQEHEVVEVDPVVFHAKMESAGDNGIVFHLDKLDSVEHRIDSIFKYETANFGYRFKSFTLEGVLIGQGSFHFHPKGKRANYNEDEFDGMLERSEWAHLHVWAYGDCSESKDCDLQRLFFCYGNPTDTYVQVFPGPFINVFNEDEIRRAPGRQ